MLNTVNIVVILIKNFYNKQQFMYVASYLNTQTHDLLHR